MAGLGSGIGGGIGGLGRSTGRRIQRKPNPRPVPVERPVAPQRPQIQRAPAPQYQPAPGSTDWIGQYSTTYNSAPYGSNPKQSQAYYGQPATPGSSITNRQLDNEVLAGVQTQYGPAQTQLNSLYGQSAQMEQKIPEWYAAYKSAVQDLAARDQAANAASVTQLQQMGGTFANSAAQASQADQAQMAGSAAIRGASIDPQAAVRAQQATALNQSAIGDQAALSTILGQNSGNRYRTEELVSEQAKLQGLQNEVGYRRSELDPQAQQLTRDMGAFATQQRQQLVNDEVDRILNQQVADWAMQKDQLGLANDAASSASAASNSDIDFAAKHGVTRAEYAAMTPSQRAATDKQFKHQSTPAKGKSASERKTAADLAYFNEHGYYPPTGPPTPKDKPKPAGLTASQQQGEWDTVSKVADFYMNPPKVDKSIGQALGIPSSDAGRPLTADEITELIRMGKSPIGQPPSPEIINVARSLASNGGRGVGPWGVGNAHRAGLQNVRKKYKVLKPKPKTKPAFPTINNGGLGG